ncbi:MAG: inositol monophosphatase family protein [Candidatus Hatepunaea meridiana]|nr:inositol monophosphatase family protein [Candidatus Hatepunaea meridiana]
MNSKWVDLAIEAAKLGGKILKGFVGKVNPASIETKSVGDWVSDADKSSEAAIISLLNQKAPGHDILAEEAGSIKAKSNSAYRWIIDPLDGTTNFLRRFPVWAVSVALEYRSDPKERWGEIIAGAIHIPPTGETFWAGKGNGAFVDGKPIKVDEGRPFQESLLATGFPFRSRELGEKYIKLLGEILPRCADVRRAGAVAVDLCYTAGGIFDGFWELDLAPWDIAAGALIISEAGGKVSNFQGGEDFLSTGDIVAGNPLVFNELLKMVSNHFPTERNVNKAPVE